MNWNGEKDVELLREMAVTNPFMHKKGTRERGRLWENVGENLNKIDGYKVDQRSVRERWAKLRKNLLKKNANEIKASGISPEMSESDVLVEELINQEDDAEKIELKNDEEKKKQDGIAMRKQAMETFAETKKRKKEESTDSEEKDKKRRSGTDTLKFLQEKMVIDAEYRKQELEMKQNESEQRMKAELELKREEMELKKKELEERAERRKMDAEKEKREAEDKKKDRDVIMEQLKLQSTQMNMLMQLFLSKEK
ncbi:stress response protein NST1-like [Anneissia japonica]|uniref:stress response protein NST1-like n=1 Tax=Anneissia japonica TaxID=1529436 RepID=UPI001425511C|nr:stress response protein NST1-like [Anneissia japonica]